jgi:ribonuclease P protein component
MLPKKRRLTKQMFPSVLSGGKRFYSLHFLAYISHINTKEPSRFAFSVSKKICKNAVDRNRLRRQGYSIVSKYIKEVKPGFLVLFSFKKAPYPLSFGDMEKEVISILQNNVI